MSFQPALLASNALVMRTYWDSGSRVLACPPPRGEEYEKSWISPDLNYVWFNSGYRSCISSQSLCGIYKTVNIES